MTNKEKTFQGQRLDNELDISTINFKWRGEDCQIGRFFEQDPLASKYEYNSVYAFSENKVIAHVELEGLESVSSFSQNYIIGKFKSEVEATYQAAADWFDNTFSFGDKTKVEASNKSKNGDLIATASIETVNSTSTNFSPFMSYLIQNNSNEGYSGDMFKTSSNTSMEIGVSREIDAKVVSGNFTATTNQDGKSTMSGSTTVTSGKGFDVKLKATQSSDGSKELNLSTNFNLGLLNPNAAMSAKEKNGKSGFEISIGSESKKNNVKVTKSIFFKIGN
jgi:hypothetical protein